MIRENPLLGIGPGSWSTQYGKYATPDDPSYDVRDLVPSNRLPAGDWIGLTAELGVGALAVLVLIGGWISIQIFSGRCEPNMRRGDILILGATVVGLFLLGILDPVLMTPSSLMLAALILGLTLPVPDRSAHKDSTWSIALGAAVVLVLALPLRYSVGQARAAYLRERGDLTVPRLREVIVLDPGDFVTRYRLAALLESQGRCDLAIPEALAAYKLRPTSFPPRYLLKRCTESRGTHGSPPMRH
jgi:hypothetical protein